MNATCILIVGCRPTLVPEVKEALEAPEVEVSFAPTLRDAYRNTSGYRPDFIVVDLEADLIDGFELVDLLRGRQNASLRPILVYQLRVQDPNGTERELAIKLPVLRNKLQRVFKVSQRLRPAPSDLTRHHDKRLDADFTNSFFAVDGHGIELSVREQELLRFLIERGNRIVLRKEILDGLWGYDTRALDVYIRRLRAKLGAVGNQIESIKGFGYRFVRSPESNSGSLRERTGTQERLRRRPARLSAASTKD